MLGLNAGMTDEQTAINTIRALLINYRFILQLTNYI